ncbi:hypothetical protein [Paenibacillus pseudetheri]|uniref:Uncharacterized protein n=1 Tax=Paenibacillus pseudetheri TaxID=2897682 RepID=A0ABM9BKZ9_9BACL|nr:hypothetical protein [Paenibacillus pseudetheri]CAH1058802.1 hypothetical protein PAECIP111894_04988 [Paenibacillus pseudetheri]
MSKDGRIPDDEAYENSLAWLVEKAKLLDDPLTLAAEERQKLQRTYDFVEQRIHEYKRGQMLLTDPVRIKLYKAAGVAYQEFK